MTESVVPTLEKATGTSAHQDWQASSQHVPDGRATLAPGKMDVGVEQDAVLSLG